MIYDMEFETLPREALIAIQLRRLRATLERVYATVPFYKNQMNKAGITPNDIQSLSDLAHIPFTTKKDLRDNYPFGMFAVPMENVVRIHASSGTTGKPTVVGYTARDIQMWSSLMARSLSAGGATRNDIIHNAYGYGLFTGGLGVHYGAEKLGASVIPVSGGNTRRQITIMKDFGPTIMTSTPSYALHLAEVAQEMGVSFRDLKFRYGIFGAEPWSEQMRHEIQDRLNLKAVDIYGLSEVMGPGVAVECHQAQNGLHIFEDNFIAEIIDPVTEKPLPYGESGELVFTSITKEAFPVIRYRTRDITTLTAEPCIWGVNVFPSQIESVLMEIKGLSVHYQLVVDRVDNLDTLTVQVEVGDGIFSDEVRVLQALEKNIAYRIKEELGVSARVKLVEPKVIARSQGKAVRVIDHRKI